LTIVVMSVFVMLNLGLMYAWSIFVAPLEAEFGWLRIQTSLTFTITMSCFSAGNFLASFITLKKGVKPALALAAFLALTGIGGASRIHTLPAFYLTYGVACGVGIGLAYNTIISIINRWFPDRQGLANGVVLMGFGSGSMLLGTAASLAIDAFGWRTALLAIGVMFSAVLLLAAILMDLPPADTVFPAAKDRMINISPVDLSPKEMLHLPAFYIYLFWTVMIVGGGLMVIGNAAPIAAELGTTATASVLLAGLLSVCNSFGRLLFGIWNDRRGFKSCLLVATGMFTASGALLILAYISGSIIFLISGFVLMGLCCGSVPSITPINMQEYYGIKYLSANLSCMSLNTFFTSIVGIPIAGAIQTRFGSYEFAMFLLPVFGLLAFLSIPGVKKPALQTEKV